jgi:hypothetical protein
MADAIARNTGCFPSCSELKAAETKFLTGYHFHIGNENHMNSQMDSNPDKYISHETIRQSDGVPFNYD